MIQTVFDRWQDRSDALIVVDLVAGQWNIEIGTDYDPLAADLNAVQTEEVHR